MKLILSVAILTVLFTATASAQNKSVYTGTKTSACRTIKKSSAGAGHYVGECTEVCGDGEFSMQTKNDDYMQDSTATVRIK